jgi:hypothetical protein
MAQIPPSLAPGFSGLLKRDLGVGSECEQPLLTLRTSGKVVLESPEPPAGGGTEEEEALSSKSFRGFSAGLAARIRVSVSILGYASVAEPTYPHPYPKVVVAVRTIGSLSTPYLLASQGLAPFSSAQWTSVDD